MYQELDENNINVLVIQEDDICFECVNKYDCPLVCAINSGIVEFVDNAEDNIIDSCELFKKPTIPLYKRLWRALRNE